MTAIRSCCAWCGAGNVRHGGASRSSASGPPRRQYSLTSSAYWSCHGKNLRFAEHTNRQIPSICEHFTLLRGTFWLEQPRAEPVKSARCRPVQLFVHAGCPCCDGNLAGASLEARFSALSRKTIRVVLCTVHNLARSPCLCNPNWVSSFYVSG